MKKKFLFLLCLIMVGFSIATFAQHKRHYYYKNHKKYYYYSYYSPAHRRYVTVHRAAYIPLPPAPRVAVLPPPPRPVILVPPRPPLPRIRP